MIAIDIHPVGTQKVGVGFEVTGTVISGIGQLQVMDDTHTPYTTPVKAKISEAPFSFWHSGIATAGIYTVAVTLSGATARSAPFQVGAVIPAPKPTPAPLVILTPKSGGSLKDTAGNTWSLSPTGAVYQNGFAVPGGGNTSQLTVVGNTIYAMDARAGSWYTYNTTSKAWAPSSAP